MSSASLQRCFRISKCLTQCFSRSTHRAEIYFQSLASCLSVCLVELSLVWGSQEDLTEPALRRWVTDRQSVGDWQFAEIWRPKRQTPQIVDLQCSVCLRGGRKSMGDCHFDVICRSKRQISSKCQSPMVWLSPCRSIWDYIPRFLLTEVLSCSREHMRGLHRWGHIPPFASVG